MKKQSINSIVEISNMNSIVEISAIAEKVGENRVRSQSAPALLNRLKKPPPPPEVTRYCAAVEYVNFLKEETEYLRARRLIAEAKIMKVPRHHS